MSDDTIRRKARHAAKADRLGQYACCVRCGDTETLHLQTASVTLCAECRLLLQQRSTSEQHHVAGRKNDAFTVAIPANDHAVLSDAQYDWPNGTLRNPNGDPLIRISAWLRGIADIARHLIDLIPQWCTLLESVSANLRFRYGDTWWTHPQLGNPGAEA